MTRVRVVVIGLTLAAVAGCDRREAPAPAAATSIPGTIVVPTDSPMLKQLRRERVVAEDLPTDEVIAPGKIEANPNRVSKVVAPVAGRVASVLVKVGDAVGRDQPLFTIESPEADATMSADLQAEAALTQARATLMKAQADVDRTKDLFEHNAIAKKESLNAENALAQAVAAVEQACSR